MDCSGCVHYCKKYNFKPVTIETIMPAPAPGLLSSSDEEIPFVKRLTSLNTSTPILAMSGSESDSDATSGDEDVRVKNMLDRVLEAVQNSPGEPEKGVSIHKIKQYLKLHYQVHKVEMSTQLKPAIQVALKRKLLIKLTGFNRVMVGSVKLNPDRKKPAKESNEPEAVPEKSRANKKRKASADDVMIARKDKKRMKA